MIYTYRCPTCQHIEEVEHRMSEIDSPTEETILKTTCNEVTCPVYKQGCEDETQGGIIFGTQWNRVPQVPNFLRFGTGDRNKGGTLSKEEKSERLRKRSDKDSNSGRKLERKKQNDEDFKKQANEIVKKL